MFSGGQDVKSVDTTTDVLDAFKLAQCTVSETRAQCEESAETLFTQMGKFCEKTVFKMKSPSKDLLTLCATADFDKLPATYKELPKKFQAALGPKTVTNKKTNKTTQKPAVMTAEQYDSLMAAPQTSTEKQKKNEAAEAAASVPVDIFPKNGTKIAEDNVTKGAETKSAVEETGEKSTEAAKSDKDGEGKKKIDKFMPPSFGGFFHIDMDIVPWFGGKAQGGEVKGQKNDSTDADLEFSVGAGMYYCGKISASACWLIAGEAVLSYTYTAEKKDTDGSYAKPKDDDFLKFYLEARTGPLFGVSAKAAVMPYFVGDLGYMMGVGAGAFVTPKTGAQITEYRKPYLALGGGLGVVVKAGNKANVMPYFQYKRIIGAVSNEKVSSGDEQATNSVGPEPNQFEVGIVIMFK